MEITHMVYAVDIVLIAGAPASLKHMMQNCQDMLHQRGVLMRPSDCQRATNDKYDKTKPLMTTAHRLTGRKTARGL
eukprot:2198181-Lingulodinium_polyedra.AAC.1